MDPIEQQILTEYLPLELVSKINIISIQTGLSTNDVVGISLSMGLDILEDITTHQYSYLKLDEEGKPYDLSGQPIKL